MTKFCFITDCSKQSGRGHLSRCLVLAGALRDLGRDCRFFITNDYGIQNVKDFPVQHLDALKINTDDVVIVDGYGFSNEQLLSWQHWAKQLVLIDDLAERPFAAELIINHNFYGDRLNYATYGAHHILAGSQYAMINPAFADLRNQNPKTHGHVLVSFGGSKLAVMGLDVAQALAEQIDNIIDVLIPAFAIPQGCPPPSSVKLHSNADMIALMAKTGLFVGALGVGYLEALAAGRQSIGVQIADNQRLAFQTAKTLNLKVFEKFETGSIVKAAVESLNEENITPPRYPDGHGAARVADRLLELFG